jgi:hypothetical protein
MASGDENFPVPKMRRELKVRPAMTKGLNDIADNVEKTRRIVEAGRKLTVVGCSRSFTSPW